MEVHAGLTKNIAVFLWLSLYVNINGLIGLFYLMYKWCVHEY